MSRLTLTSFLKTFVANNKKTFSAIKVYMNMEFMLTIMK